MPRVTKATNERPITTPRTTLEVLSVPSVSSTIVLELVIPISGRLVHTVCFVVVVVLVVVDLVGGSLKKTM